MTGFPVNLRLGQQSSRLPADHPDMTKSRVMPSPLDASGAARELDEPRSFTARARGLKTGNCRGPRSLASAARRPDVAGLVERAGEFLPWHWNRPQLGHCSRTPRSAELQRCDHVVP